MKQGHRYLTSTAVLLNEIIKLVICIYVALRDRRKIDGPMSTLATRLRGLWTEVFRSDSWKLAIPAALYTFQNSLQYIAVSNLDAATFQVTYQLKILTTALFSVTMLQRKLSTPQWISLFLLTAGIAIVQIPVADDTSKHPPVKPHIGIHNGSVGGSKEGHGEADMNRGVGLIAVTVACTISGLAGVYFEKVLKGSSTSLWVRNIQLSFFSLFPAFFIGVALKDGREIMQRGFFDGYNIVVWTAIGFQAVGGIVVALCVNYADNIAKNFSTSISILLSSVASVYFFRFHLTPWVCPPPLPFPSIVYHVLWKSVVKLTKDPIRYYSLYSEQPSSCLLPSSTPSPAHQRATQRISPLQTPRAMRRERELPLPSTASVVKSGNGNGNGKHDRTIYIYIYI